MSKIIALSIGNLMTEAYSQRLVRLVQKLYVQLEGGRVSALTGYDAGRQI